MPPVDLHQLSTKLDNVFKMTDAVVDDEIKGHLSRYLCILTSGYLEEALKLLLRDYVYQRASRNIHDYISSQLHDVTNLKHEKIASILGQFNGDWRDEFIKKISPEEKDALDSIYSNRNQIAHGQNTGISYVNMKDWYKQVQIVVSKLKVIIK